MPNTINFTCVDSRSNKKGGYLCLRAWETDDGELQICYISKDTGWDAKVVKSLENMLSQVLCETVTFLCVCITEDTDETPKQFFKKATVCFLMLVGSKSSESNTGMYKGWEKITQR